MVYLSYDIRIFLARIHLRVEIGIFVRAEDGYGFVIVVGAARRSFDMRVIHFSDRVGPTDFDTSFPDSNDIQIFDFLRFGVIRSNEQQFRICCVETIVCSDFIDVFFVGYGIPVYITLVVLPVVASNVKSVLLFGPAR